MDSDLMLKSLHPELYALLIRVKSIYVMCGGDNGVNVNAKQMKAFDYKKTMLISRLVQLDNLAKDKKKIESTMSADSRDMIRMKNQMRFELTAVETELKQLIKQSVDEAKGDKVKAPELAARNEVIDSIKSEYYKVYEEITDNKHAGDKSVEGGGVGMSVLSKEALIKGTFAGAGMKMEREALSGENMAQLEAIRSERAEQEGIIDEIGKTVDELKDLAERMGDELQLQEKMLEDLDAKTDKAQSKLDKVNESAKDVLSKLNDKSTNCCIYLICLAILGAMAVIVFRFVSTKK